MPQTRCLRRGNRAGPRPGRIFAMAKCSPCVQARLQTWSCHARSGCVAIMIVATTGRAPRQGTEGNFAMAKCSPGVPCSLEAQPEPHLSGASRSGRTSTFAMAKGCRHVPGLLFARVLGHHAYRATGRATTQDEALLGRLLGDPGPILRDTGRVLDLRPESGRLAALRPEHQSIDSGLTAPETPFWAPLRGLNRPRSSRHAIASGKAFVPDVGAAVLGILPRRTSSAKVEERIEPGRSVSNARPFIATDRGQWAATPAVRPGQAKGPATCKPAVGAGYPGRISLTRTTISGAR